jgi:hypothetical protein
VLYPQLLGHDFEKLPRALRDFHSVPGGGSASGTASVRRTRGWLAGMVGFPPSGDGIPVGLQVVASESQEIWIRRFGVTELRTVQRREGDLLLETVGPLRIYFRVFADPTGMRFQSQSARLWIVPILLRIEARVWGNDSSWEFQVTVAGVGSYRGTMVPTV